MQLGQRVIRHGRKDMVLYVIVHVPIEEPEDRIHVNGARIQPMIEDVLGEPNVLRDPAIESEPPAVQRRQTDVHRRQNGAKREAGDDDEGINGKVNAGGKIHFPALALGHESRLLLVLPTRRVQKHLAKDDYIILKREGVEQEGDNVRGTRRDDFGVAPNDDRIRVVARMAPAPDLWLTHDHEAGDLINRIVHPLRLERGAMAALVPATIGRGAIKNAVNDEKRDRSPGPPKIIAKASGYYERRDPDQRIPDLRTVLTAHQLFKLRALDRRRVPFRRREPGGDSLVGLRTDEAGIASDGRGGSSTPCPKAAAHKPTLSVTRLRLNAALVFIVLHPLESGGPLE